MATLNEPTPEQVAEAADLASDFGLLGMTGEGHKKLALLVAELRRKTGKAGRPRGSVEKVIHKPDVERVKPLHYPTEIVKGTGWRIR